MPRSSAKIGLLFITSALSVMGFDAYREHHAAQRNDFRYDGYFPGTIQPSGYYHNGTHYQPSTASATTRCRTCSSRCYSGGGLKRIASRRARGRCGG